MITLVQRAARKSLLWTINRGVCSPAIGVLHRLTSQPKNVLRVLTYHRVDEPSKYPDLYPGVHSAAPSEFARQLDYLGKHFQFVSLQEVISAIRGESRLPAGAVLVTFDDAYQGFADYAWPELSRRDVPTVLFVPTAFPDQPRRVFWWDRLHWAFQATACSEWMDGANSVSLDSARARAKATRMSIARVKSLPHDEAMSYVQEACDALGVREFRRHVLSWDSLRELAQAGVTMAAHTHTHPLMNRISVDEAREEVIQSRDELSRQIGQTVDAFAYPAGAFCEDVVNTVSAEGFELAFTTQRGTNALEKCERMKLRRINVGTNSSVNAIRIQLLGYGQDRH